ncbi:MAG: diaminopimelate epimerase [Planctomycetota bacterium]
MTHDGPPDELRLRFVKMEGAGNDYVYVDGVHQALALERVAAFAARIADRHYGVGGDGVILMAPSRVADVRMVMWNADGSRGAMCGNGIRCVAKLAHDEGLVTGPDVVVETDAGVRRVTLVSEGGRVVGARVAMGEVTLEATPRHLSVDGRTYEYLVGDAGNPHAVVFVDDELDHVPVARVGTALQTSPPFATGVNVEFVRVDVDGSLHQRTFERGSGETLACGSGATVAVVAAVRSGRVQGPSVVVHLRGGDLTVEIESTRIVLQGPAREVFRGEIVLA